MSNIVSSQVQTRKVGSLTLKAVLMYMADKASDDGSGIWVSKSNMAADLEMSLSTVKRSIKTLAEQGVISESGKRNCKNGYTVDYTINLGALKQLESTRFTVNPVHSEPRTRSTVNPDTVHTEPQTIHEPPIEPPNTALTPVRAEAPARKVSGKKVFLPDDFFGQDQWDYATSKKLSVEQIRTEAEKFKNHFRDIKPQKRTAVGWESSWRNWVLRVLETQGAKGVGNVSDGVRILHELRTKETGAMKNV